MIDKEEWVQYAVVGSNAPLLSAMKILFPYSKDRLFSFILCGQVKVDEETVKDHTRLIKKDSTIALYDYDKFNVVQGTINDNLKANSDFQEEKINHTQYVSRAAHKLDPVLKKIGLDIADKIWLDCGCSSGGFTQCLLEHGASAVHSVDVAYNVLDYILRIDSRVIVHERTNALHLKELDPPPARAVADLSFRSLRGIARHILSLCEERYLLALCKPQFEYAFELKHKKKSEVHFDKNEFDGVLAEDKLYDVIFNLMVDLFEEEVLVKSIHLAGIKGRQGNQEFFLELVSVPEFVREDINEDELLEDYRAMLKKCIN